MEYYAPVSLKDAEKLKKRKGRNFLFAGGCFLNWRGSPKADSLIDIKNLGLGGIRVSKTKIVIGASVTVEELADNKSLPDVIRKAAKSFETRNVRNMATAGGVVAGKFFVSHLLPVFAAYQADIEYYLDGRKKKISLKKWLQKRDGIICSVIISKPSRKVEMEFEKISAIDLPLIVSAAGCNTPGRRILEAVFAVSGAENRLVISSTAEKYINGKKTREISIGELTQAALSDIKPSGNFKASARVKKRIIESHIKKMFGALLK